MSFIFSCIEFIYYLISSNCTNSFLEKYEEIKKQFKECEKNVIKLIKEHIEQTLRKHGVQLAKRYAKIINIVMYHLVFFMMDKNYLSRKQLQMPLMYILPILAKI